MLRVSEDEGRRRQPHAAGYGDLGHALLDLQAAADQVFDAVSKRVRPTIPSLSLQSPPLLSPSAETHDSC
jgi:hypothetical protein